MIKVSQGFLSVLAALAVFTATGCTHTVRMPELDAESSACIKCHAARRDHRIGIDYAEAFRLKKTGLVPPSSLNPSVRLIGGRIACATCHVRYSEDDHKGLSSRRKGGAMPDPMLVMDNGKSALCFACHRK